MEWAILFGAGGWVVALALWRWPAPFHARFDSNSTIDAAFFALAGQLVRDGGVPYLAFWDHKPPLIYLINALALAVSDGAIWGVWLATVGALLAALGMGYAAMRRTFGATAAVVGATCFSFSLGITVPFNLTEGYVLPVQAAVMLLVSRWSPKHGSVLVPALGAGVLAGLAFLLRPNLVGAPVAMATAMGVTLLIARRPAELVRLFGGLVAGAVLVIGPVLLWLAEAGALDDFWNQVFQYNFVYAAASWGARIRTAFHGMALTTVYGTLLLPLAGWVVAMYRLRMGNRSSAVVPVLLYLTLWAPTELVFASVPGRTYTHYFAPLLLPLAYLTALAASVAFAAVDRAASPATSRLRRPRVTALLSGVVAIVPVGHTLFDVRNRRLRSERAEQVDVTAQYVRANTTPSTPLFVWGHASDIYFLADRKPATRFVYPLALLTPGYTDSRLVAAFLDELRASAPALIVDATPNTSQTEDLVPPLAAWDPNWRYPETGVAWWAMTPAVRGVYDYIKANYEPRETIGPRRWVIYRRVAVSTSR